jgi:SAM-dependent methyltransferase
VASGLDPRGIANLRFVPTFVRDYKAYRDAGGHVDALMPVLSDYDDSAGQLDAQYFAQDLYVARRVFAANPLRHIDIGSRIDGFISHLAVFRSVEVLDVRPAPPHLDGAIHFVQFDITRDDVTVLGTADSVSCLHSIEHFGLGRYGDPVSPDAHRVGLAAIERLVRPGGCLYLSVPVGRPKTLFNAHRIFDPEELDALISDKFSLQRFTFVDDSGEFHVDSKFGAARDCFYGCGIYEYDRTN